MRKFISCTIIAAFAACNLYCNSQSKEIQLGESASVSGFDDNNAYCVDDLIQEMSEAEAAGNFPRVLEIARFISDEPIAQYVLGLYHLLGRSVERDPFTAAVWMRKAAVNGLAVAQYNYGMMLKNADGVSLDDRQGLDWLRKAAEQGDNSAAFNLAYFLNEGFMSYVKEDGEQVAARQPDYKEARKWAKIAADQGNPDAQYLLDYCIPE